MDQNSNMIVSLSEAVQDFSKVTKLVDQYGSAVILKNNTPRYFIVEFQDAETSPEENELMAISDEILERNAAIYKELAK